MKANSILIVGCGDLGRRTGGLLSESAYTVAGVCRNPGQLPGNFTGYSADYCQPGSLSFIGDLAPDYVLATFKPASFTPQGYQLGFPNAVRNLLAGLGSHRPKTIFMVSSTRVFAEHAGARVDEDSALATSGFAAEAIVEAEQLLQASGHTSCIVRFGGIYGALPSRFLAKIERGEFSGDNPVHYSNRIHRDDCAGFLAHLIGLKAAELAPVYVAVDDESAPQNEVEQWLAQQMGIKYCPARAAVDRPRSNKRCDNARMKGTGYSLCYPSYREGYRAVLEQYRSTGT